MHRQTIVGFMAALCAAGVLASCGGGGDGEGEVKDVVEELESASREGDGARICNELFTENLAISIRRAAKQPCADEVTQNVASKSARFTVAELEVDGDKATAQLVDEKEQRSDVLFERDGDSWRIARIAGVGS